MFKRDCERSNRFYLCIFSRRFIFEEGKYVGFYHPKLKHVLD